MPRPPITLSEEQCREVETLAALLNLDQIADYFGISRTTFKAICARDEAVAVRYKRGKARAIAHVANGLLHKARRGDSTSSIFYLKTQAGWRETASIEHSGPEGGPIALSSARERIETYLNHVAQRVGSQGTQAVPSGGLNDDAVQNQRRIRQPPGEGGGSISGPSKPGPAGAATFSHGHDSDRGSDGI
ncbi:hypothetical protein [Puniceibacterium confluentis]|uniref:hypothetical protein n=1 Tax=Puniceibacterium confluentis TaxID=1958944 RepID=UPI0035670D30